jgi:hypothetical protein
MALPSNPQTLASYDIAKGPAAKIFVKKVSDLFQALSTAIGLSGILNGSGTLNGSALTSASVPVSALEVATLRALAVSTNQTLNCSGAYSVSVLITFSAALTLTLNNLGSAVPVCIRADNTTAGALVLKCVATDPSSASYTVSSSNGGAVTSFSGTGVSVAANTSRVWNGSGVPGTPNLNFGMS